MKKAIIAAMIAGFAFGAFAGDSTVTQGKTISAGKFTFTYSSDGANLIASVSAPVAGWIAVGFNPTSVMKQANMIVGYMNGTTGVVVDQYGDGMFSHKPDTALGGKNDIILSSVTRDSGVTTMSFTIPLDSGDKYDSKLIAGEKVKLIFAAGKTDDIAKKHSMKATATIKL